MTLVRGKLFLFAIPILLLAITCPLFSQIQTGAITGRAVDNSGALIPGVEVSITSPAMIGGARSAPTDESGTYRFTQLTPGTYRVSFGLPGFKTLNQEGVLVQAGATMTINGTMEVAAVAEEVTVTSQAPTIDLEQATVGVNWGQSNMDNLPWGRSVVALAEMVPGMYITNYDVGGNQMGGSSNLGGRVYGRSGGEVRTYDGVEWCMGFDDFETYEEVQLNAAAKGAESQSPGVTANYVIKSGGNDFHGTGLASWEDGSFQGYNVDSALISKGFPATASNNFTRYNEFGADIGGPILHNKFWFYGAINNTYTGQNIAGFVRQSDNTPAVYSVQLKIETLKLSYQLNQKMKLETSSQYSLKEAPYRNGSLFTPLEATQHQKTLTGLGPTIKWTYIMSPKMTTTLGIERAGYWWPTVPWTTDVRKVDLATTQTRGAYLDNYSRPIRWQWNGSWSYFTDIGGKSNEIQTGFLGWWDKSYTYNNGYPNQQLYQYRSTAADVAGCSGVNCNYFSRPVSVQVFDYPNYTASVVDYEAWYANDKIKLSKKLTVNIGARFDHFSNYLPAQGNPGIGPFAAGEQLYPQRNDFPIYHKWSPRISVAYDVRGDGRVALKASYGEYGGTSTSPGSAPGAKGSNVNQAQTITRTYTNWDGSIPYVPVAANLSSVSGGGGIQLLDPNLKTPVTRQYTGGVQVGWHRDYLVGFNAVRTFDYGGSKIIDNAMPYSAYTDIRCAVDPGRDNVVTGGADHGTNPTGSQVCVYSVPKTYPTFGQINQTTTQYADGEATKNYTAFEGTFQKQQSKGWSVLFGYTLDFGRINNAVPTNPNQALYNFELPQWNQSIKMNGTYALPYGIKYASTYQIQSGAWYGRTVNVTNATGANVAVNVEQHFGRYPFVKLWDNRLSKTFKIGDKQTFEGMFDLYNTLNANTLLSQVTTNGSTFLNPTAASSGSTSATAILPARIFKLGARYRF